MDRKKIIYIGSLLIITAIISIASFSYAIWSRTDEQHGKINIVAGTLNYELISSDLNNNSITVPAGTNKTLEIEIKSLNTIDSKYELYYTTTNNGISIGYSEETIDQPTGTISSRSSKKVTVIIKNRTNSSGTITFGCQGGFSSKQLVLAEGNSLSQMAVCTYNSGDVVKTASYTGGADPFNPECDGYYKVELWGAQGGNSSYGGKGGYTEGIIFLNEDQNLYVYVGGDGITHIGYNGGGTSTTAGFFGGGATDIRYFGDTTPSSSDLNWNSATGLNSRIMVAAGGSGAANSTSSFSYSTQINIGANAGGLTGYPGNYDHYNCTGRQKPIATPAQGGSQTTAGSGAVCSGGACYHGTANSASFGIGAIDTTTSDPYYAGGGGGGYYGGGGGVTTNCNITSSAGGSSYISGHTGCVAIAEGSTSQPRAVKTSGCTTSTTNNECSKHYSGLYFIDTNMIDGSGQTWTNTNQGIVSNNLMPNPSGGYYSSGAGRSGDGYARITYIGDIVGQTWEYDYSGAEETFNVPVSGRYKIETWGASSQDYNSTNKGGLGGYSSGIITLSANDNLYVNVGQAGTIPSIVSTFNGGGQGSNGSRISDTAYNGSGGGATDVRTVSNDTSSRIIVAGGGGGATNERFGIQPGGGHGGGLVAYTGLTQANYPTYQGYGGTQISGGAGINASHTGSFFQGCNSPDPADDRSGGGGGWYGGGCSYGSNGAGGGGSSYISGHTGCVAVSAINSTTPKSGCTTGTSDNACSISPYGYTFTQTNMIDGAGHTWTNTDQGIDNNNLMPNPSGGYYSSGIGHSGNGFARITYLGN